jgi:hypothetical protein
MPGEADYEIVARIVAQDAAIPGTQAVEKRLDRLEKRAEGFGNVLGSSFAKAFAVLGGTAGIGMAVKGIVGLNSEIETATNGMATLFSAFTGAPIDQSLGRAKGILGDLRKDAKAGVGELTNYTEGFQKIFGATGGAVDDQSVRQLTRNALAAGFALRGNEGLALAPMDIAQALSGGVSRAETPIVMTALQSIGMSAEKFNKLDPAKKVETLNKAFGGFAGGVELMGKSWDAQFSTLLDNVKELARTATKPLFDRWSEKLREINEWFAAHEEDLADVVQVWGRRLLDLWDQLITKAGIYAGIVVGSALAPSLAPGAKTAAGGIAAGARFVGQAASASKMVGVGTMASLLGPTAMGAIQAALAAVGATFSTVVLPVVAIIGIIALAIGGMYGALQEWSGLFDALTASIAFVTDALGELFGAFGSLVGQGSILNMIGGVLVGVLTALLFVFGGLVKAAALFVETLGLLLRLLGAGAKMAYAAMTGDVVGGILAQTEGQRAIDEYRMRAGGILGLLPQPGEGGGETTTPPVTTPGDTNINGPITITVKAEVNEDPARVAVAFDEVLGNLERYRRQPRRPVKPPAI